MNQLIKMAKQSKFKIDYRSRETWSQWKSHIIFDFLLMNYYKHHKKVLNYLTVFSSSVGFNQAQVCPIGPPFPVDFFVILNNHSETCVKYKKSSVSFRRQNNHTVIFHNWITLNDALLLQSFGGPLKGILTIKVHW